MVYAYFNHGFSIRLKRQDALDASGPGPADEAVAWLLDQPYIKQQLDQIGPRKIREELKEYGAWDDDELTDDDENRARIVWIAAGNIREEEEYERKRRR